MTRSVRVALALLLSAGCAKKLEGPAPQVSAIDPGAVCTQQLDTTVTVSGEGFAPLLSSALTDAKALELPKVELVRAKDLDGAGASGTAGIPDDPSAAGDSQVRWLSQQQLSLTLTPALALEPGLYDVAVTNPDGQRGSTPGALLAVPPPDITSLSQDLACQNQPNQLTLNGDFFLRTAASQPSVAVGDQTFVPSAMADCRALPGNGGYEACRSVTIDLPEGALAAGAYPVRLTNPSPAACQSAEGPLLTVFDRPAITSLQPLGICTDAMNQNLELVGTGFLTVAGVVPTVTVGTQTFTPTPSVCTDVTGTLEAVQSCTHLTFTVPQGTFAAGSYPVVVTNPPPVDCASSDTFALVVSPPPDISSVQPAAVCSGSAQVTITGQGFADGAKVTLNGIDAQMVTVTGGTTAVARFAGGLPTGGPFAVTLSNPDGCSATSMATVQVVPGPQVFFVDPNVIYNGIQVQATVYGTGFIGAVQSVSLTPSAGGNPLALSFTYDAARPNQVQVIIPQGTAAGDYDLSLNDTSNCTATLAKAVKVVDQVTLALGMPALTPEFGWVNESTGVTVNGAGFLEVPRLYLNPVNPGPGTVATAVGAVTFLDPAKLTALVPGNKLPVGQYDLIVVNPDGGVGVANAAFTVTSQPPPSILSLAPGSVANTNPQTFTINGADFRMPQVALTCIDSSGVPLGANPAATVTASTATSIKVSFDASLAGVACVVRVTNTDDATFTDFSALVITNPAANLYPATFGPNLATARRAPVALGGDATSAARYLHVIGGDDGTGMTAFGTVETAPLDLFGKPSPFVPQRTTLTQARAFAGGAKIGRWLYVAGGSAGGMALDTVERAVVLDPDLRGEVTDLLLEVDRSAGLGAGVWYYRIAAVMGPSDPFNPNGENLASDPFPVQLPDLGTTKLTVTVGWQPVIGAVKYRVYRSPTAGATVGTEEVIAEVMAPSTSYKDAGGASISADRPLPIGSLGTWQVVATLSVPREGPGVSWGADPADPALAYLYVFGGRSSATAVHDTYELLPLTLAPDGSQAPAAAFVPGALKLGTARWQLGATRAVNEVSSRIPPGSTYLYALGGLDAAGTAVGANEAALVQAGGQLGTFTALPTSLKSAGYFAVVAGNYVFSFGGSNASPSATVVSGQICAKGVGGCTTPAPPDVANWNAGQAMLTARYLHAGTLSGAFIYTAGGVTSLSPLMVTNSTEYRLW